MDQSLKTNIEIYALFDDYVDKIYNLYYRDADFIKAFKKCGITIPKDILNLKNHLVQIIASAQDKNFMLLSEALRVFITRSEKAILLKDFTYFNNQGLMIYQKKDTQIENCDLKLIFIHLGNISCNSDKDTARNINSIIRKYWMRLTNLLVAMGGNNSKAKKIINMDNEIFKEDEIPATINSIITDFTKICVDEMKKLKDRDYVDKIPERSVYVHILKNVVNMDDADKLGAIIEFENMEKAHYNLLIKNIINIVDKIFNESISTKSKFYIIFDSIKSHINKIMNLVPDKNQNWNYSEILLICKSIILSLPDDMINETFRKMLESVNENSINMIIDNLPNQVISHLSEMDTTTKPKQKVKYVYK